MALVCFLIFHVLFLFSIYYYFYLESYEEARKKEKMYSQFNDTESEMEHLMETGRNKRKEFLNEMDFNEFFEPNKENSCSTVVSPKAIEVSSVLSVLSESSVNTTPNRGKYNTEDKILVSECSAVKSIVSTPLSTKQYKNKKKIIQEIDLANLMNKIKILNEYPEAQTQERAPKKKKKKHLDKDEQSNAKEN